MIIEKRPLATIKNIMPETLEEGHLQAGETADYRQYLSRAEKEITDMLAKGYDYVGFSRDGRWYPTKKEDIPKKGAMDTYLILEVDGRPKPQTIEAIARSMEGGWK